MEELKTISPAPASPAGHDPCAEHHRPAPPLSSRRAWMFKLGIAFNAIAGILIGIPILGYVLSGLFGKKDDSAWINLGPIGGFPEDQTRLATYKNPFTQPWDGETGNVPCWVRHIEGDKFQVFAINYVSLPRRRLLRRRPTRLRSASARSVCVPAQNRKRPAYDLRRSSADAGEARVGQEELDATIHRALA
jgi:hypothetical protein